jgi:hypothetical protein
MFVKVFPQEVMIRIRIYCLVLWLGIWLHPNSGKEISKVCLWLRSHHDKSLHVSSVLWRPAKHEQVYLVSLYDVSTPGIQDGLMYNFPTISWLLVSFAMLLQTAQVCSVRNLEVDLGLQIRVRTWTKIIY